jgi:hypothetical protein
MFSIFYNGQYINIKLKLSTSGLCNNTMSGVTPDIEDAHSKLLQKKASCRSYQPHAVPLIKLGMRERFS